MMVMPTEVLISVENNIWVKLGEPFTIIDNTYEFYMPNDRIVDTYNYLREAWCLQKIVKIKVYDVYSKYQNLTKQTIEFDAKIAELSLILPSLNRTKPTLRVGLIL